MTSPPVPVRLTPMTWDEYDAWSAHSVRGFAAQQVAAGLQPEAEAVAYAARQHARLLPDGLVTPLHLFWTVRAEDDMRVGRLWMRVRPLPDEVEAYVFDVEIVPDARGRGLGRATLLAGERAAVDLGATVVRLNVFGHNTAAVRLYEGLGYVVTSSAMEKRLDVAAAGPFGAGPPVEMRAMTQAEYAVFRPRLEADCATNIGRSGALPPAEARRRATEDVGRLLPDGLATAGHRIWTAYAGDEPVAHLWVRLQDRSDGRHAFGFDLGVGEAVRRGGYARSVLEAAEQTCRDLGVTSVGVSVFGFDAAARALYERSGFAVTAQSMAKQL